MSLSGKNKINFVCTNCGAVYPKWLGRCMQCGEWNTVQEHTVVSTPKNIRVSTQQDKEKIPQKLSDIETGVDNRLCLSIPEVDRPLGGGLVSGSVILWGGEPGIGKSTLILQICNAIAMKNKIVLYCSGEESELQIKLRAERLGMHTDNCLVLSESSLDKIFDEVERINPTMLVIDSIQTMFLSINDSAMGSPGQIRDCTASLVRMAKERNMIVMIIGHVTKEGNIAGPRLLEHMVDVVFYLEGDRSYQFRILRTVKNRFGSTAESGLFIMKNTGLEGIDDPSRYLLKDNHDEAVAGCTIVSCMEGLRPVLSEIQALTVHSVLTIPRRIASGYDFNRLIILLAVLEKKLHIPFSTDDVYINVVGGYRIKEPAADLAVALALISIKYDISWEIPILALGEIGLSGEIMGVSKVSLRLKEGIKMNFTHFMLPERNKKETEDICHDMKRPDLLKNIIFVKNLNEAIRLIKSK